MHLARLVCRKSCAHSRREPGACGRLPPTFGSVLLIYDLIWTRGYRPSAREARPRADPWGVRCASISEKHCSGTECSLVRLFFNSLVDPNTKDRGYAEASSA